MNENIMESSHTPTMNLRFVRKSDGDKIRLILQQMFVPKNWNDESVDIEWRDIQIQDEI